MVLSKDVDVLKLLNKKLKEYRIRLKFQYYDVCPFEEKTLELMETVLKHVNLLESYYNKIFILSSLCDKHFKDCVPCLVSIYHSFIGSIYKDPTDEMYLLYICNTLAKINSLEHKDLYMSILCSPLTPSAEPVIKMLAESNMNEFDDVIFGLIKKENIIPQRWFGEPNEDSKYWCSYIALKCIVDKKDEKYLAFFQELLNDEHMEWIHFSDSKYKEKLTIEWKNKYKKLAGIGIRKLKM